MAISAKAIGEKFERHTFQVQQAKEGGGWWVVAHGKTIEEARVAMSTLNVSWKAMGGYVEPNPAARYRIVKVDSVCEVVE